MKKNKSIAKSAMAILVSALFASIAIQSNAQCPKYGRVDGYAYVPYKVWEQTCVLAYDEQWHFAGYATTDWQKRYSLWLPVGHTYHLQATDWQYWSRVSDVNVPNYTGWNYVIPGPTLVCWYPWR